MSKAKILIAGLDKSGKSSIIHKLFINSDLDDYSILPPTRGVNYVDIDLPKLNPFVIWELGGQKLYRDGYLNKPQMFASASCLFYVIDICDEDRFELSLDYFNSTINLMKEGNFHPRIAILMHKSDPKILKDIRANMFSLQKLFKDTKTGYNGKISFHATSIYSPTLEMTVNKILSELDLSEEIVEIKINSAIQVTKTRDNLVGEIQQNGSQSTKTTSETITPLSYLKAVLGIQEGDATQNNDLILFKEFKKAMLNIFYFKERSSSDEVFNSQFIGDIIKEYARFFTLRLEQAYKEELIDDHILETCSIFLSQLNLCKIPILHFIFNNSYQILQNDVKFFGEIQGISAELLDTSYITELIDFDMYRNLHPIMYGGGKFTILEDKLYRSIHKFSNLEYLLKENYSPLMRDVKSVRSLITHVQKYLEDHLKHELQRIDGEKEDLNLIRHILDNLDFVRIELWYFIRENELKEYDIDREFPRFVEPLLKRLLKIFQVQHIINKNERNRILFLLAQN